MRKVFRYEQNAEYWDRRWQEVGVDRRGFEDLSIYPIAFAERIMASRPQHCLEIGVGSGRVLMHYHYQGLRICGVERSEVAVRQLREFDAGLDVRVGDALDLPFAAASFDAVLAYGVYHNLEDGVERGFAEVARVLRPGGRFSISMRPDNVEMRLNESYWRLRSRRLKGKAMRFHKLLITEGEGEALLRDAGLAVSAVLRARNMPILYRIPFLRAWTGADERAKRARGYKLNALGRGMDALLQGIAPAQFCNGIVYEGAKP